MNQRQTETIVLYRPPKSPVCFFIYVSFLCLFVSLFFCMFGSFVRFFLFFPFYLKMVLAFEFWTNEWKKNFVRGSENNVFMRAHFSKMNEQFSFLLAQQKCSESKWQKQSFFNREKFTKSNQKLGDVHFFDRRSYSSSTCVFLLYPTFKSQRNRFKSHGKWFKSLRKWATSQRDAFSI